MLSKRFNLAIDLPGVGQHMQDHLVCARTGAVLKRC
jgi:hypothetical protein